MNEDYRDWQQIKGIQMEARCEEVQGVLERARAMAAYLKKYPFVARFLGPDQALQGMRIGGARRRPSLPLAADQHALPLQRTRLQQPRIGADLEVPALEVVEPAVAP